MRDRLIVRIHLALCIMAMTVPAVLQGGDTLDKEFQYRFLEGTYRVIGKKPGTDEAYTGTIVIVSRGGHLEVERNIREKKTIGRGELIESNVEGVILLKVSFEENDANYVASYTWSSDLDNYARISGYVYRPGVPTEAPGLECLFIDHSTLK